MAQAEHTKGIPVPHSSGGAPRMRAAENWPSRGPRPEQGNPAPSTSQKQKS